MGIFILLCLCFISYVTSQTEPQNAYITPSQIVTVRETVTLSCRIENSSNPVLWKRKVNSTDELISANAANNSANNKFVVNFDSPMSTYNLTIKDIDPSDIGTYICETSDGQNNSITAETKLELFEEPTYYNSTDEEVKVTEGSNFTIKCYAKAKPAPTLTIKRYDASSSSIIFSIPGNEYKINNINKTHEGNYTCEADAAAVTIKRSIRILVSTKPIFQNCTITELYNPEFSTEFVCVIDSVTDVKISWFRNETQLTTAGKVNITTVRSSTEKKLLVAKLNVYDEEKYGVYLVTAKNDLGDANRTVAFLSNGDIILKPVLAECPTSPCGISGWVWFALCVVLVVLIGEMIFHRQRLKLVYDSGKTWCEERFRSFQGQESVQPRDQVQLSGL